MLAPHNRTQLLEALRPPAGYRLTDAIATTYSLDLLALLVAPVGFTSFELQDSDGPIIGDGDVLMLLRTIRRHASKMTVFCQAGQIAGAPTHARLLTALEPCVVEVSAPLGGVFHPKVWVLRYVVGVPESATPDGDEEAENATGIRYRVLVSTRNLTFDRSWDTLLTLDGELADRSRAFAANRPLADFVAALPTLATRPPVLLAAASRAARLADELRRVEFESPFGFESLAFHSLGLTSGRRSPILGRMDKLLVLSPFVTEGQLNRLGGIESERVLVSRPDVLAALPPGSLDGWKTWVLDPDADGAEEPVELEAAAGVIAGESVPAGAQSVSQMLGLHAKLYVADAGTSATVWTGSANATNAAFNRNVEFLVELGGKRTVCGVDAILDSTDGTTSLRELLLPFRPDAGQQGTDDSARELEDALDDARRVLASLGWQAIASPSDMPGTWKLELLSAAAPAEKSLANLTMLTARPITLNDSHAKVVESRPDGHLAANFIDIALESISAFIALTIRVDVNGSRAEISFVITVALEGAPESRHEAILRHLLRDREQVLRFLMLLLTDDLHGFGAGFMPIYGRAMTGDKTRPVTMMSEALLEPLLRVLHRSPERLDELEQFAQDLAPRDPHDAVLLPDGFHAVISTLRSARAVLK